MSEPRCVALVTPCWPTSIVPNGIAVHVACQAAALRDRGVRVILLAWRTEDVADHDPDVVRISSFDVRRRIAGRVLNRARKLLGGKDDLVDARRSMLLKAAHHALNRFPVELIELEESFGYASDIAAWGRLPVVTRLHGPWFIVGKELGLSGESSFPRRERLEGDAIAASDGVTAAAEEILERTRRHYGLSLPHAAVIPSAAQPHLRDVTWEAERCDPHRIAFIGRFDLVKGADLAIRAFALLARQRSMLRMDFVGPDRGIPIDSGKSWSIAEFLEREISNPEIRARITIHGELPPERVAAIRQRAAVTIVPSRYETFGYAALDALAQGCPLLAADVGGLTSIVKRDETGLMFPSENFDELAAQTARLLDDRAAAARLARAAKEDIAMRFDPSAIAARTLEFYAGVLGRRQE